MKQKLPCAHQHGDAVNLHFGDAGTIRNSKITKISFDPGKVFYDVEIKIKPGMVTRLRMIDSAFLEKVTYQYAFKCVSFHEFIIGQEYFAYDDPAMTIGGHVGGENPLVKFVGYNSHHGVAIFESTYKLNKDVVHYMPVSLKDGSQQLVHHIKWINNDDVHLFIPDYLNHPTEPETYVKTELTEYDKESLPQFSIRDIDEIFDDERRNHGTMPLVSINRMYRKLLALKEKRV